MKTVDLGAIVLGAGSHDGPDDGMCLLEAVAWIAGEPWSDRPKCVSAALASFGRSINDMLPHEPRQRLTPLIPTLIGTRDDGLDETRGHLALDWLVRTWTPAWLEVAGLSAEAAALRDLRPIVDLSAAQAAGPVVLRAERAAKDAVGATAQNAVGIAVENTLTTTWSATWSVAWVFAGAETWAAAAGDATCAAARAVTRIATEDATWAGMVTQLHESAIDLLTRMIRPGGDA